MTTATCMGCTLLGIEGQLVEVQVDMRGGLPGLDIVGLPDRAVSESARRVRAAIRNSGFTLPPRRITVNLAPADVPKQGVGLDLPIAVALIAAAGCVPLKRVQGFGFYGQLSLDGSVVPVPGALPAALALRQSGGLQAMLTAPADVPVAARSGLRVMGLPHLRSLALDPWPPAPASATGPPEPVVPAQPAVSTHMSGSLLESERCFRAVLSQCGATRAMLLAAAGEHSILFLGPPGIGKTLLARAVHALLPPLGQEEALETAAITSAASVLSADWTVRPLRAPSPRSGARVMFGGGQPPAAGEITLAHRGVLLLDELHQFKPDVLAGLAAVMEAGEVIVRYKGRDLHLPARALIVGTSNLCPCGRTGAVSGGCACTPAARRTFWTRLSGPLLDRVDLQVEMSDVPACELVFPDNPPNSEVPDRPHGTGLDPLYLARAAVLDARKRQEARFGPGGTNGLAGEDSFRTSVRIDGAARDLLQSAQAVMGLSARAYFRTLRVAATAADIGGHGTVTADDVAEALAYRSRLRPIT